MRDARRTGSLVLLVGGGVLCASAFGYHFWGLTRPPVVRLVDHGPPQDEGLRRQVAALQEQVRNLQAQRTPSSPAPATPDDDGQNSGLDAPADQQTADEQQKWRDTTELLDEQLQSERRDTGWAREAESGLRDAFERAGRASVRLEAVECRQTLCKLEMAGESREDWDWFADEYQDDISGFLPRGKMRMFDDEEGRVTLVGFFARDGHKLPAD